MVEVNFNYEGIDTIIQSKKDDKMKDIIDKFLMKIQRNDNDLIYLYNGLILKGDLTFNQQANEDDRKRNKMSVIVRENTDTGEEKNEVISKEIICPICKENIILNMKDYKINLSGCKNNHDTTDILLNKYEDTQKIDLNKIMCDICNQNNKGKTYNNEFYICNTCNKNICPLCKSIHEKDHIIINYDDKNYICKIHNDSYIKYCKTWDDNLCIICQNEHNNHETFELSEIIFNRNDLIKSLTDLKEVVDKFKNKIERNEDYDISIPPFDKISLEYKKLLSL